MQAVIDYLRNNQSRFIDELCEYVRFPSVSAQAEHRPDMAACGDWLMRQCRSIGLVIFRQVLGPCQRGLHRTWVAHAVEAAMLS